MTDLDTALRAADFHVPDAAKVIREHLEALRAALIECRRVMLVEDSLHPGYGWKDHVTMHVDPALTGARAND